MMDGSEMKHPLEQNNLVSCPNECFISDLSIIWENITDGWIRDKTSIGAEQFGFMPGRSTHWLTYIYYFVILVIDCIPILLFTPITVGSFDGESTKFRDWIKLVEKYVLLAGKITTNPKTCFPD